MKKIRLFDIAYWGLLLVGLLFGGLFVVSLISPDVIDETIGQSLQNKGEDYNFIIGVPLAAIGSFVAAIIAAASRDISKAQYDVQASEIADRKLTSGLSAYRGVLNKVDDSFTLGRQLRETLGRIAEDLAPHYPTGFKPQDLELPDAILQAAEQTLKHLTPMPEGYSDKEHTEYKAALQLLRLRETYAETMCGIIDDLQFLSLDPFWSVALQSSETKADWARPLTHLLDVQSATFNSRDGKPTARRIARILADSTFGVGLTAMLRAPYYVPNRNIENFLQLACFDFELFGSVFELHDTGISSTVGHRKDALDNPDLSDEERAAMTSPAKLLNFGAADLICLVNALPDAEDLRFALNEVFPELARSKSSLMSALFRQLPNKTELCSDELLSIVEYFTENPDGLIYEIFSDIDAGDSFVSLKADAADAVVEKPKASFMGGRQRRREPKGPCHELQLTAVLADTPAAPSGLNAARQAAHQIKTRGTPTIHPASKTASTKKS